VTTVRLDDQQLAVLELIAAALRQPVSETIRAAIDEYVATMSRNRSLHAAIDEAIERSMVAARSLSEASSRSSRREGTWLMSEIGRKGGVRPSD
jgi:predicted transcriptional regulator